MPVGRWLDNKGLGNVVPPDKKDKDKTVALPKDLPPPISPWLVANTKNFVPVKTP